MDRATIDAEIDGLLGVPPSYPELGVQAVRGVLEDFEARRRRAEQGLEVLSRLHRELQQDGETAPAPPAPRFTLPWRRGKERPLQARLTDRLQRFTRRVQRLTVATERAEAEHAAVAGWRPVLAAFQATAEQSRARAEQWVQRTGHALQTVRAEMDAMVDRSAPRHAVLAGWERALARNLRAREEELATFGRALLALAGHEAARAELEQVFGRLRAQLDVLRRQAERSVAQVQGNLAVRSVAARAEELQADLERWAREDAEAALLAKETARQLKEGLSLARAVRQDAVDDR